MKSSSLESALLQLASSQTALNNSVIDIKGSLDCVRKDVAKALGIREGEPPAAKPRLALTGEKA